MCLPALIVGTTILVSFLTLLSRINQGIGPLLTFVGGILSATVATPALLTLQQKGVFGLLLLVVSLSIMFGSWNGKAAFKRGAFSFFGFSFFAGVMSLMNRFDPSTIESLMVFSESFVELVHAFGLNCDVFNQLLS